MSKILTVAKGEFYRYFISPLAYVYLISFLLLNGSFALYFGGIFTSGNASLKPMFDALPWLNLIFISGIAMRLWAEEFKSGTILRLMTLPIPLNAYIWGKFLAAWGFCTLALLLTFPFVLTLNFLASPDNGIILNSYFGAFLLSGAMLAIAQTASALSKNQVIALIISVTLNLLFFLSGLEYILGFVRQVAPDYIVDMVASFSFLTHASNFNLGLFESRSLIFLISLIVMFNFFTLIIISYRTSGTTVYFKLKNTGDFLLSVILILSIFVGINLFANNVLSRWRFDATAEKLFTPTETTKHILQTLPAEVSARVYYSPILGERDEAMRLHFDNLRLLLQTYSRLSKGHFHYQIYNPEPLSDIEDRAIQAGIQALPVSDMNAAAYFGIVLTNENGHRQTIPFLPLSRKNLLEQDLTENIYLLEHKPQTLGILTSLPLFGTELNGVAEQPWQIIEELKKYYKLKKIDTTQDLQGTDLLLMAHPQNLTSAMENAVYDYSLNGGKILAFFDISPEALKLVAPQNNLSHPSNYGSLPEKWGFKFYDNAVVADLDNASYVALETDEYNGTTQDLIQFYLTPQSFFATLPETKNLKKMLLTSASVFTPLKDSNIYFIPLAQASQNSALLPASVVFDNIHPTEILRRFKPDNNPKYIAAHIISQQKDKAFEIIVVGDSDMLYDSFWTSSTQVGDKSYNIPLLDNGNFVLNALDTLAGQTDMTSLRGKSPLPRPFTTLEKQQKQILQQFKIKEKDIFDEINFIKRGLNEIWNKKDFEGRENFTPDELSVISKIKNNLKAKHHDLYALRLELNGNLQRAEFWVKLANIYAIPLLIIFGLLIIRLRKHIFCFWSTPHITKQIGILASIALLSLALGGLSVYLLPENTAPAFEGTPLFPDLTVKINQIDRISLQNKDSSLVFTKQDGVWILPDHPEFLVKQSRIKYLLSTLLRATIIEKRADKIENITNFGFLPLDNPNSTMTHLTLSNSQNAAPILNFDIGQSNIDLGRGAQGAYVRFPERFQIWLTDLDLVDLNLDYRNWSYAHLWDLHFGRFTTDKNTISTDTLVNLVKDFLSTPLEASSIQKPLNIVLSLTLHGENFDSLNLDFYEQDKNFYVQFQFNGVIKSPVLQQFADKSKDKFYRLDTQYMDNITHDLRPE
jgi:ABC-2 type transport system permease protein